MRSFVVGVSVAIGAVLGLPAVALGAPPPNDPRTAPQEIGLPATVTGTTRDSTVEPEEPGGCAPLSGSVWYEIRPADATAVVVRLQAGGDLDAAIDVYRRTRSQLAGVDCDVGDDQGRAELRFRPAAGANYLIRVGQRAGSVPGDFRLQVFAPQPPPKPPGRHLPASGIRDRVDAVQDTADAYAARLREGRPYRVDLSQPEGGCVSLAIYAPGKGAFDSRTPARQRRCGGYLLVTPRAGEGGMWSFVAQAAPRRRGAQRYHLQVAPARGDDVAPGVGLPNYARARGTLRGDRVDAVDLYRFSLARRSDLRLELRHGRFTVQLLDDRGHRLAAAEAGTVSAQLPKGRYYAAVVAGPTQRGAYVLRRVTRTITRTAIAVDGTHATTVPPGRVVDVGVTVAPFASGPADVTLERFDPLSGWRYVSTIHLRVAAGAAHYALRPAAEGRWRVSAAFLGTRRDAPSASGRASVLVAPPLGA